MKEDLIENSPEAAKTQHSSSVVVRGAGAFVAVGAWTYYALAHGLGWLVTALFAAGLIYACHLVRLSFGTTNRPPVPAPGPASGDPKAEASADLRGRVLDELIRGATDPEVMAEAEKIVGPKGHVVACYIDLRMALLSGKDRSEVLG